jgi:HEPN domain-containing protein
MIDEKFKMLLYEIARFCFRDVADNDYLSARILFRYGFIQQAYWNSEQAVEKYLKSILLFNEMSAKSVGHDLELALSKVESIPHINIELPDDVRSSIVELNNEGKNRYFEYPYHFSDLTFYKLDKLIWHIRRYCIPKGGLFDIGSKKINLQEYELIIAHQDKYKKNPSKYSFASKGIIEKILNDKKSLQRKQLIWKNQYFGRRQKKVIKNVNVTYSFGKPPHFSDSCNVDELSKYVQLNDDVIKYLKNKA